MKYLLSKFWPVQHLRLRGHTKILHQRRLLWPLTISRTLFLDNSLQKNALRGLAFLSFTLWPGEMVEECPQGRENGILEF
jgi:hypothetical protein